MTYGEFGSSLRDLPRLRTSRRRRASSWDRTGGNDDRLTVQPGRDGGARRRRRRRRRPPHLVTVATAGGSAPDEAEADFLRRSCCGMVGRRGAPERRWSRSATSSASATAAPRNFSVAAAPDEPRGRQGLQLLVPDAVRRAAPASSVDERVRRADGAASTTTSTTRSSTRSPTDLGYFHAQWRRENPTDGSATQARRDDPAVPSSGAPTSTGEGNYAILDAAGRGHYVGCNLNIHNLREHREWNWYGEGDDMIFIDGEPFPPTLHGTGTEDYFNTAWCPTQAYSRAVPRDHPAGRAELVAGKISLYRFHVEDPVRFRALDPGDHRARPRQQAHATTTRRSPTGTRPSRTGRSTSRR